MIKATMTAIDARSRSGQSVRAIPQTAWATIATATSLRPCSRPARSAPKRFRAVSKEDEQYGGWQREGNPGGKAAEIAAPHQANGKSNLAAGRPRQKLAQRDEIGEGGFVDPAAPDHKFFPEIANVGDWTAKAAHAELGESEQHLPRRAGSIVFLPGLWIHSDGVSWISELGAYILSHQSCLLVFEDVTVIHERMLARRRLIEDNEQFRLVFDQHRILPTPKMCGRWHSLD